MLFLKAITITKPIDAAIISSFTPIMTMIIAALHLKEPVSIKKVLGLTVSIAGAMILIFSMRYNATISHSSPLGIILMFLNCFFFALYLGFFRPLIQKYSVVTFMKWMFLFSAVFLIPFDIKELISFNYTSLPTSIYLQIGFIVLFSTFIAYFLLPYGQKILRPTIVSMYSYVQPIVASLLSAYYGLDNITWMKVIAALLVFTGVYIVTKSKSVEPTNKQINS